jgi:hypothetical protein
VIGNREPGIVDEYVDRTVAGGDRVHDDTVCVSLGQVGADGIGFDAVRRNQCLRQRLQPVEPAGHKHNIVPGGGELSRKLRAQSCRGSRHESNFASCSVHRWLCQR